uniref:Flavoprotein domain-containing protein n=1 Tax=Rhabditophanes sp. KR3021 TaxID=114890 RepID=A0AC35TR94_9BILA
MDDNGKETDISDETTKRKINSEENGSDVILIKKRKISYSSGEKLARSPQKFHLLMGVTGSPAAVQIKELLEELKKLAPEGKLLIKIIATDKALQYFDADSLDEEVYGEKVVIDSIKRGDPILHVELKKWADALLLVPLDASTITKAALGVVDNLLMSVISEWDVKKTVFYAPAISNGLWSGEFKSKYTKVLKESFRWKEIPPLGRTFDEYGYDCMASTKMISTIVVSEVKNRFAVYSSSDNA